ncbi:hypothetical protein BDZ97DRAFT_300461 [Flammula alnicola]|nr:hypothetical protein BDZ97DRAFT_300461 [Flammula alnicola]
MPSIFGFNVDLNPTYGAYLIGTFLSNILLGVTCVQTYIYFREYQTHFSMHVVYHYLINNFLSPLVLLTDVWSVNVLFGITGSIVLVVHLSYATRIYYVSGKKLPIPIFISILSSGNFALGWVLMGVLFHNPVIVNLAGTPDNMAKAILISGAVLDFLIAGTLSYYLNNARTGIKQTDQIIDRLMLYAINNGILTSLFDIASVILVFTRPKDLISLAISQVIGNLYSNSWMATLNSRARRSRVDHTSEAALFQCQLLEQRAVVL